MRFEVLSRKDFTWVCLDTKKRFLNAHPNGARVFIYIFRFF